MISSPAAKDLFYFDRFYHRGEAWYAAQFPDTTQSKVRVEVCHDYLFSEAALDRIAATRASARLVVAARHPLERAVSAYHYMVRQGRVHRSFSDALRTEPELLDHGMLGRYVEKLLGRFPREQLLLLDFELLRHDPLGYANTFLEHLGVTTVQQLPSRLVVPVLPAAAPRSPVAATVGKRTANVLRRLRGERLVARAKASRILSRALFRPLSESERARPSQQDVEYAYMRMAEDATVLDRLAGTSYLQRWWLGDGLNAG